MLPVGRLEGDIRQCPKCIRLDAGRAGTHELCRACHYIVSDVAGYRVPLEGDRSFAYGTSAVIGVWAECGVGSEIPEQDIAAPVARSSDDETLYGRGDVELGTFFAIHDHLLGEIEILAGIRVVDLGKSGDLASIQVEGRSIDILPRLGIVKDGDKANLSTLLNTI